MNQREEFKQMIGKMRDIDVQNTPIFKTTKALYDALVAAGMDSDLAAKVVGTFKIEVGESFVDDKELFDFTIDTFCNIVMNVKTNFDLIHPKLFEENLRKEGLSLKYEA